MHNIFAMLRGFKFCKFVSKTCSDFEDNFGNGTGYDDYGLLYGMFDGEGCGRGEFNDLEGGAKSLEYNKGIDVVATLYSDCSSFYLDDTNA